MSNPTIVHASFTLERHLKAPRRKVFNAFAHKEAKARWFGGSPDDEMPTRMWEMDFRVGGEEKMAGGPKDGPEHRFDARYLDIVDDARIIYSYNLFVGEEKLSSSLTTIELLDDAGGTLLVFTEYGAFLDGLEDPKLREEGTGWLLGKLAASVEG